MDCEIDEIHLKNLLDEDFANYKEPAMLLGFTKCTFKCEKELGLTGLCQNEPLNTAPSVTIKLSALLERYRKNMFTRAVVCGGLEPFDTFQELYALMSYFRKHGENSKFIVYTGYTPDEILDRVAKLSMLGGLIVKYGRFVPGQRAHMDPVLGVELASGNQYAVEY